MENDFKKCVGTLVETTINDLPIIYDNFCRK